MKLKTTLDVNIVIYCMIKTRIASLLQQPRHHSIKSLLNDPQLTSKPEKYFKQNHYHQHFMVNLNHILHSTRNKKIK